MDLCGFGAEAGAWAGVAVPWGRQGQDRMLALWVVQLVVCNAAWHAKRKPPSSSSSFSLPTRLSCSSSGTSSGCRCARSSCCSCCCTLRLNSNRLLMPTILTNVDVGVGQTSIDARGVQKQKPKQTTAATTIKGRQGLEIDMYVSVCACTVNSHLHPHTRTRTHAV